MTDSPTSGSSVGRTDRNR